VRCSLLVILAAVCAFGQDVTVGLVFEQKIFFPQAYLVPAGTLAGDKWTFGATTPPKKWELWGKEFSGVSLNLAGRCPYDNCWLTDLQRKEKTKSKNTLGVVASPPMHVVPFEPASAPEQAAIRELLDPTIKRHLDSRIAAAHLAPTKVVAPEPPTLVRSRLPALGETYFHARYVDHVVHEPGEVCKYSSFIYQAWLAQSDGGALELISSHSQLDDCDGVHLAVLNPVGAVMLNGACVAVGTESYYEGESTVVLGLSPQRVLVLVRNHWTQD
jgi:hypothetical protein